MDWLRQVVTALSTTDRRSFLLKQTFLCFVHISCVDCVYLVVIQLCYYYTRRVCLLINSLIPQHRYHDQLPSSYVRTYPAFSFSVHEIDHLHHNLLHIHAEFVLHPPGPVLHTSVLRFRFALSIIPVVQTHSLQVGEVLPELVRRDILEHFIAHGQADVFHSIAVVERQVARVANDGVGEGDEREDSLEEEDVVPIEDSTTFEGPGLTSGDNVGSEARFLARKGGGHWVMQERGLDVYGLVDGKRMLEDLSLDLKRESLESWESHVG